MTQEIIEIENPIVEVITNAGVEEQTALTLQSSFLPFFDEANKWREQALQIVVTSEEQVEEMRQARKMRLALRDVRIQADKKRKELKEDSLRYGKAVQGVYNVIEYLIAPIEQHLETQEKFAELQAAKRKAELSETRRVELQPYAEFVPAGLDLGGMNDESYSKLLSGAKLQYENKLAEQKRIEDERIARLQADAEERERMRLENERLRAEVEERERIAAEERAKAEAERKAAEEKARIEREEQERRLQAERERVEAELKAKAEAERKAAEEKARIEREKLAAPDKVKMVQYAQAILNVQVPTLSTTAYTSLLEDAVVRINKIAQHITSSL